MSDQDMPLSAWADKDGIEPPDLGLTSHPHPIDLEAELDMILHRFMYTFAPDGTVKPENFVTLDVPQAKQAIKALMLELVDETSFAYRNGEAYAEVLKKKVSKL